MEATPMRKVMIALSTLAAIGIAMPVMTGAAQAETKKIIMKKAIAAITKAGVIIITALRSPSRTTTTTSGFARRT
jgi:hypothetical protein